MQHLRGAAADLSFVDIAKLYCLLELLAAHDRLAAGGPSEAVEPLAFSFAMIERLAQAKHLVPRLEAADLRSQSLQLVAAAADHPQCDRATLESLLAMISRQLARWPADAQAWIGDRAMGLHTYEMIRHGELLSLLTDDELAEYHRSQSLPAMFVAVAERIDEDELFYLSTMRELINNCEQSFPIRRAALARIRTQLAADRRGAEYPILADRLMLTGLEDALRKQSADRGLCQGWALALAAAAGAAPPEIGDNPLTGKPYHVERNDAAVTVSGFDTPPLDRPVILRLAPAD